MTATGILPAGITVVATVRLKGGTAGHAVQKTPWIAVTGDTAMAAPLTDGTVTTPPLIIATAHPTDLLTAHPTALLTARLTATGHLTALGTTPLPDAMRTPMTPTAGTLPQRDRPAATRSPMGTRPY